MIELEELRALRSSIKGSVHFLNHSFFDYMQTVDDINPDEWEWINETIRYIEAEKHAMPQELYAKCFQLIHNVFEIEGNKFIGISKELIETRNKREPDEKVLKRLNDQYQKWRESFAVLAYEIIRDIDNMISHEDSGRSKVQIIYDLFLSYASGDSETATELKCALERRELNCFMAEKDIGVAEEWQDSIRTALLMARYVLILLTPNSINRPWIFVETGAAWALGKPLIPALSYVTAASLPDPIRRYQARPVQTTEQRRALVNELSRAIADKL